MKTVLLVEDDPKDAELTLIALKENNLANAVVTVEDGQEALDYMYRRGQFAERAGGNPAVILLDLKMPRVNGIDVLRELKSNSETKSVPVVVLTSSREDKDIVDSYRLGVNAYVRKPVDFGEFMSAVQQLGMFWAVLNEVPASVAEAAQEDLP